MTLTFVSGPGIVPPGAFRGQCLEQQNVVSRFSRTPPQLPSQNHIRRSPRMCTDQGATAPPKNIVVKAEPCTYCHDEKFVECPACEGRGYFGRTITCYYCHGAKVIPCPLCVDDIDMYHFSYTPAEEPQFDDEAVAE